MKFSENFFFLLFPGSQQQKKNHVSGRFLCSWQNIFCVIGQTLFIDSGVWRRVNHPFWLVLGHLDWNYVHMEEVWVRSESAKHLNSLMTLEYKQHYWQDFSNDAIKLIRLVLLFQGRTKTISGGTSCTESVPQFGNYISGDTSNLLVTSACLIFWELNFIENFIVLAKTSSELEWCSWAWGTVKVRKTEFIHE